MKYRYNFNKCAKMNLLCPKDKPGSILNCIYFNENNAIASDGYVMLVVPVSEISTLLNEDIDKLNGKLINKDDYKDLLKFDKIRIDPDGIVGISEKTNTEIRYIFKDIRYVNYKAVINSIIECEKTQTVSFKAENIANLCKIMDTPFATIKPNGNGPIKITFENSEAAGLMCPYLQKEQNKLNITDKYNYYEDICIL